MSTPESIPNARPTPANLGAESIYNEIGRDIAILTNNIGIESGTVFKKLYSDYNEISLINGKPKTWNSWLDDKFIFISLPTSKKWIIGIMISFILLFILMTIGFATFENKNDPYGTGIRFLQRRDDTGSPSSSLEERKYYGENVSQLTSTREAPDFSEYYGIEADIKGGSVMIERENFENLALSMKDLEKANKGN